MVYKVCKGGIRSGNTLRGLQSARTRRYASQGCIISQSSLGHSDLQKLLENNTEDARVSTALGKTGVILSLNKKQRWTVPATVTHMIRSGRFSSSKTMVSLLERHKLKRRANCVGFACSKGTNQSQGHQKRYFSYKLDYADQDESRREWRKRRAKELQKLARENKVKKDCRTDMRTAVVTTIDGRETDGPRERYLPSTKPEVRLEVFYPCPQSCSLTFNPKYTDVVMTQNDEGEMEVKSNVMKGHKRSQRKHRKRLTLGDVETFSAEAALFEEDVEEMWREETQTQENGQDENIFDTSIDNGGSRLNESDLFSDNILARLLESAEMARAQWKNLSTRSRQRSRYSRVGSHVDITRNGEHKSHIVHTERQSETVHGADKDVKIKISTVNADMLRQDPMLNSVSVVLPNSEVTPRYLRERFGQLYAEADCHPRRFCINISEDVTNLFSNGKSLASQSAYTTYILFSHNEPYDKDLGTYSVTLNCSGVQGSQHLTYSMPPGVTNLDQVINCFVGNLLDLNLAGFLDFPKETQQSYSTNARAPFHEMMMNKMKMEVDTFFTSDELKRAEKAGRLQEKNYFPTDDNDDSFMQSLVHLAEDYDIFCEICYDSIKQTDVDAAPGTQLRACGHQFCDGCWRAHLRTRFREGSVRLGCPAYQCDAQPGLATLLSLLHVSEVAQLLRRECEDQVETSLTAKWCPSPTCGRVLRLRTTGERGKHDNDVGQENCRDIDAHTDRGSNSNKSPDTNRKSAVHLDNESNDYMCLDVVCACGERWCFQCLAPAHWPARCEQAQDYLHRLDTLTPIDETGDDHENNNPTNTPVARKPSEKVPIVEMEGRLCPKCRRFIEKNGGCPHMACKCGHHFCWSCMQPFHNHTTCHPNPSVLYEFSRRVKVRHLVVPTAFNLGESAKKNSNIKSLPTTNPGRRQRSSMYQRALQQRLVVSKGMGKSMQELANKISKAASKDLSFKREILQQCGAPTSQLAEFTANDAAEANNFQTKSPVAYHVMRYLGSYLEMCRYLRHVTEYTYVLLQDCPPSQEKRRALQVTSNLVAYCSFSDSVLEAGAGQNPRTALKRLADIHTWTSRTLDVLITTVHRLKQ